jgi:hypothetical protein
MPQVIVAKIDVTKIDKARLFAGRNGAQYLDIVLIPTRDDRYGNSHIITQSVSKEEREKGIKGAILGNAKTMRSRSSGPGDNDSESKPTGTGAGSKPAKSEGPDADCPF